MYDLAIDDGAEVWHHDTTCSGGGGRTTAFYDGRVYARDGDAGVILTGHAGGQVGSFISRSVPAFRGSTGFFLEKSTLRARDLSTMDAAWSFAADGTLVSEPLVIDGRVFVASSSGRLWSLRRSSGRPIESFPLRAPFVAPDEHNSVPLSGMNAGEGLLLVPASGRLVAFD